MHCKTECHQPIISAQTEGDTGYDYNDPYDDEYDDESGQRIIEVLLNNFTNQVA